MDGWWSVESCRWVASPVRDPLATPWSVAAAPPVPVVDLSALLPVQRVPQLDRADA